MFISITGAGLNVFSDSQPCFSMYGEDPGLVHVGIINNLIVVCRCHELLNYFLTEPSPLGLLLTAQTADLNIFQTDV